MRSEIQAGPRGEEPRQSRIYSTRMRIVHEAEKGPKQFLWTAFAPAALVRLRLGRRSQSVRCGEGPPCQAPGSTAAPDSMRFTQSPARQLALHILRLRVLRFQLSQPAELRIRSAGTSSAPPSCRGRV